MKVIDSAPRSIIRFIRVQLGRRGLTGWLNALKKGAWMIFEGTIPAAKRYPIKEIVRPRQKLPWA